MNEMETDFSGEASHLETNANNGEKIRHNYYSEFFCKYLYIEK